MENLTIFGDIGKVLGYPAMLLVFWLYNEVQGLKKKNDEYEKRFATVEKVATLEKRLGAGDDRFERLEKQMGEMNGTLNNILGKVDLLVTLKEKR